jgi:uncharacterized protein (TIGR03435 family)
MMKTLLADRFKMVSHYESREMPIYALVAASADRRPTAQDIHCELSVTVPYEHERGADRRSWTNDV